MSERIAKRRTLFTVPPAPSNETALLGTRCTEGHVAFPPQRLGCEVCGAFGDQIESIELAATGTLRTFALSHREQRPGSNAPLIIGTVALDAGPEVEVILEVDDPALLSCGQQVTGQLVGVGQDESGKQIVDCFFAPAPSSEVAN